MPKKTVVKQAAKPAETNRVPSPTLAGQIRLALERVEAIGRYRAEKKLHREELREVHRALAKALAFARADAARPRR